MQLIFGISVVIMFPIIYSQLISPLLILWVTSQSIKNSTLCKLVHFQIQKDTALTGTVSELKTEVRATEPVDRNGELDDFSPTWAVTVIQYK